MYKRQALAEAEIEYQDDPCTTVYVKFPMHDDLGKLGHLDKSKLSFVIWTTTIWTLPGNLAIALHPDESYAIVRNDDNGEMYIVAEEMCIRDSAHTGPEAVFSHAAGLCPCQRAGLQPRAL